jgi:hypothetical protein
MSTPNLINSDNVGNFYYGWRTNLFVGATQTLSANNITLRDFINSSFGQICAVTQFGDRLGFTLPHPSETISLPALGSSANENPSQTGSRIRFGHSEMSSSNSTASAGIPGIPYVATNPANTEVSTGAWQYWCLNSSSLSYFSIAQSGNDYNNTSYIFKHFGWVKNPLYSGSNYPLNAYYFFLSSATIGRGGGRPTLPNNNTRTALRVPTGTSADAIANYSITCQTSTPGANTTDLIIRDDASPNRAIGVASNLLKTSLAIPVGQIYPNEVVDPDGSNNPFWMCVGVYGSERILMRVWTQGITFPT